MSLKGKFEATLALAGVITDFVPKPIAWGLYLFSPDSFIYLYDYQNLVVDKLLSPRHFCQKLFQLYQQSIFLNGGNFSQENQWSDTWEEFFF